jgi:membrane protein YdbS with pleckstrin-like domain
VSIASVGARKSFQLRDRKLDFSMIERGLMEAVSTSAIPDGVPRQLDPQFIAFQRVSGLIFTGFVAFGLFIAAIVVWLTADFPRSINLLLPPAWLALSGALAAFSYFWPKLEYRRTSYVLDERGIEIRSGVLWRAVTNVPRSRVQHIDVSQGPLERAYRLGRLVIYTAGTDHSRIELPGLGYHVAFALRNHLLPRGDDDAV